MINIFGGISVNIDKYAYIVNDTYKFSFFPFALLRIQDNNTEVVLLSVENGGLYPQKVLTLPTPIVPLPPFGFVIEGKLYITPISLSGLNDALFSEVFYIDFPYKFYTLPPNTAWIFEKIYLLRDLFPTDVIKNAVNTLVENLFQRSIALITNLNIYNYSSTNPLDSHISIINYENKYSFTVLPYFDTLLPTIISHNIAIPTDYEMIEVDIQDVYNRPEEYVEYMNLESIEVSKGETVITFEVFSPSPYLYDFATCCVNINILLKLTWVKQKYGDVYISTDFAKKIALSDTPSSGPNLFRVSTLIDMVKNRINLDASIDAMKEYALSPISKYKDINPDAFQFFKELLTLRFLFAKIRKLWVL